MTSPRSTPILRPPSNRSRCRLGTAAGLLATLGAVLLAPPPTAAVGNELTPAEVECNRSQLSSLVGRMAVEPTPPGFESRTIFATYSNRFGAYEGLVARTEWVTIPTPASAPPAVEALLSFHLNPDVRELLLNPERPTLDQVSLTLEISTSNLVPPGDERTLVLRIDPTLNPDPLTGAGDLVIDNLASPPAGGAPGYRAADTQPGRGLTADRLTEPCHTRLTSFDRRMLAILQRVLRFTVGSFEDPPRPGPVVPPDVRVTLYRGEHPSIFLADVELIDRFTGVSLEPGSDRRLSIALAQEPDGEIVGLVMGLETVPPQPGPWFVTAYLARPGFDAGVPTVTPLADLPLQDTGLPFPPMASVDWDTLLGGTTWAPRTAAGGSCGLGTPEELAAAPRADRSTELLALAMGNGLTAGQGLYDRLVGDLAAIRGAHPELENVDFLSLEYDGKTLLLNVEDEATGQAMEAGTYDAWDCLNDHYGLESVHPVDPIPTPAWVLVAVRLEGLYHLETIAPAYADLPGIASAAPFTVPPPAAPTGTLPSLCADDLADGTVRYFFDLPMEGGTWVWYFRSEPGEEPVEVGLYNPMLPTLPPDWLPLADECYAALRFGRRG